MPRVTNYTSSATATVEVPFRCAAGCGYEAIAGHTAKGSSTRKVQGWGHAAAEQQVQFAHAQQAAHANAITIAKSTLRLTACPQCGKRSAWAVTWFVFVNGLAALIAATISVATAVFSFGSFSQRSLGDGLGLGCVSLVTALISFGIVVSARGTYRNAKDGVVFRAAAPTDAGQPILAGSDVFAMGVDGAWYPARVAVVQPDGVAHVVFTNGAQVPYRLEHLRRM